jgi:hypothetical protein
MVEAIQSVTMTDNTPDNGEIGGCPWFSGLSSRVSTSSALRSVVMAILANIIIAGIGVWRLTGRAHTIAHPNPNVLNDLREALVLPTSTPTNGDLYSVVGEWNWCADATQILFADKMRAPCEQALMVRYGFPLRSTSAVVKQSGTGAPVVEGGIMLSRGLPMPLVNPVVTFVLPLHLEYRVIAFSPMWSGLVGNGMIFVMLWLIIECCMKQAFERMRVARGRCAKCGYEMHRTGATGCPECGWNRPEAEKSGGRSA